MAAREVSSKRFWSQLATEPIYGRQTKTFPFCATIIFHTVDKREQFCVNTSFFYVLVCKLPFCPSSINQLTQLTGEQCKRIYAWIFLASTSLLFLFYAI